MGREVLLEPPVRYWRCPSCTTLDRTQQFGAHTRMHDCPGHGGLNIPMCEVADPRDDPSPSKVRHVVHGREDFVGGKAQEEYTPLVASVVTERADGSNDVTVFAATAVGEITSPTED